MPVLNALEDNEEELCKFVLSKIEGLLASKNEEVEKNKKLENNLDKNEIKKEENKLLVSSLDGQDEEEDELEQVTNAAILRKFQKLFEMSADEKLVNCKKFENVFFFVVYLFFVFFRKCFGLFSETNRKFFLYFPEIFLYFPENFFYFRKNINL